MYKFRAIPTKYNGVEYRSRLEAKWAVFFDLIGWKFTYEPYDLNGWSPDFKIQTNAGTTFITEVKPKEFSGKNLRLKLGKATNFSQGVLLISESPFSSDYPNCIGFTSIFGETVDYKNEKDFEFCASVVMNLYGQGYDIYNLCEDNEDVRSRFRTEKDFCSELWKKASKKVQFLKPK